MQILFAVLSVALAVIIVVLHVLSAIFSDKRSTFVNFVNIALHIVLVFTMLLAGAALELLALVFMVSLLVYVIAFAVRSRALAGAQGKEGDE